MSLESEPLVSSLNPLYPDRIRSEGRGGRDGSALWRNASPQVCYRWTGPLVPALAGTASVLAVVGLWVAFVLAPTDRQQGEAYRILYVHVPAAWLSMVLYLAMAFWAGLGLVMRTRVSALMARAIAPTGALFTALALWTGALWGRPTWGAWWVWDARLTSELLLLFLYLGVMALQAAIDDPRRGDRAGAVLALVGVVNVPVIYFSVTWWNTLHQGATINLNRAPSMATPMLAGLLLCTLSLWAYAGAVVLARLRTLILEREQHTAWARSLVSTGAAR